MEDVYSIANVVASLQGLLFKKDQLSQQDILSNLEGNLKSLSSIYDRVRKSFFQGNNRTSMHTNSRREQIKLMLEAGVPRYKIQQLLDISVSTLQRDLAALGAKRNRKSSQAETIQERRDKILELKQRGLSNNQIRQELDIKQNTLARDITALIASGRLKNSKKVDSDEIIRLYKSGVAPKEIAARLDVTLVTVYKYTSKVKLAELI